MAHPRIQLVSMLHEQTWQTKINPKPDHCWSRCQLKTQPSSPSHPCGGVRRMPCRHITRISHQQSSHPRHLSSGLLSRSCCLVSPIPFAPGTQSHVDSLGVLIANADGSLVIASSQYIASEFNALSDASWLVTSYVLAQCASQPLVRLLIINDSHSY